MPAVWTCPSPSCGYQIASSNPKPYTKVPPNCNVHPGKVMVWQLLPDAVAAAINPDAVNEANDALAESFNGKHQTDERARLAALMGIADKGHKAHGSNFNGAQTRKQLIDNLFAKVTGDAARQTAATACKGDNHYNPITGVVEL